VLVSLFLLIGALTPVYEINRSMIRTDRFHGYSVFSRSFFEQYFRNPPETGQVFVPEYDHLNTLTADEWKSVSIPNSVGWDTKAGSLFDRKFAFLWKPELINRE